MDRELSVLLRQASKSVTKDKYCSQPRVMDASLTAARPDAPCRNSDRHWGMVCVQRLERGSCIGTVQADVEVLHMEDRPLPALYVDVCAR